MTFQEESLKKILEKLVVTLNGVVVPKENVFGTIAYDEFNGNAQIGFSVFDTVFVLEISNLKAFMESSEAINGNFVIALNSNGQETATSPLRVSNSIQMTEMSELAESAIRLEKFLKTENNVSVKDLFA